MELITIIYLYNKKVTTLLSFSPTSIKHYQRLCDCFPILLTAEK